MEEISQSHLCLYLVDLVVSAFDDDSGNTAGQNDQNDDDHLLVRKKRAVLSSGKPRADLAFVTVERISAEQVFRGPALVSTVQQQYVHPARDLFFPLHNSNGPPSA